jgi:hypothetical protein
MQTCLAGACAANRVMRHRPYSQRAWGVNARPLHIASNLHAWTRASVMRTSPLPHSARGFEVAFTIWKQTRELDRLAAATQRMVGHTAAMCDELAQVEGCVPFTCSSCADSRGWEANAGRMGYTRAPRACMLLMLFKQAPRPVCGTWCQLLEP